MSPLKKSNMKAGQHNRQDQIYSAYNIDKTTLKQLINIISYTLTREIKVDYQSPHVIMISSRVYKTSYYQGHS